MTTKQATPTETLNKLISKRHETTVEVAALKRERSTYEAETTALRLEYGTRASTHPEEFDRDGNIPLPGTESERLSQEVKARYAGPHDVIWPDQEKLDKAITKHQAAINKEQQFRITNLDALIAERNTEAEQGVEKMREGWRLIRDGAKLFNTSQEQVRDLLLETEGINAGHLAHDPRPIEWSRTAEEAIEAELLLPDVSHHGRSRLDLVRANLEAADDE